MVHMIGKAIGAYTDETHGLTLSAVTLSYYRYIMEAGLPKFVRFAENVWDVDPTGMSDSDVAEEGLRRLGSWMNDLGVVMDLESLGVTDDMIEGIADSTIITHGGYRGLTRDDIINILRASMRN